jgi:4-hydroxybenzoate polyprenyltransferase
LQDEEFDRKEGLNSIPVWLGRVGALRFSTGLHLLTGVFLLLFNALSGGIWAMWLGTAAFICLLVYQHLIVRPNDLSRVNAAFFTSNGIASLVFAVFSISDLLIRLW